MGKLYLELALASYLDRKGSLEAAQGDIVALVMLVMMEASKSEREDLKSLIEETKKVKCGKQGWREANRHWIGSPPEFLPVPKGWNARYLN